MPILKKKAIDYKKELESAARTMILVHEPGVLIRMILRRIIQKVQVRHAAILLHDQEKDTYVLTVSRGPSGIKIPAGFARMDKDNPLIRFFLEGNRSRPLDSVHGEAFISQELRQSLRKKLRATHRQLLHKVIYQMDIFNAVVCIPSYFRRELLGLLLLGRKRNGKQFSRQELNFFVALASDVAMAIRNAQLFKDLENELDQKQRLFMHTVIALAAAIEAKDRYTHGHTARVTNLSLQIAKKLSQKYADLINKKFLDDLQIASLLHDIGKIGIPEHILNKEGPLAPEEQRKMEEHPLMGVNILQPIKELENCLGGIKHHHEKFDGSGYPDGLRLDQIPLIASIIAVADAFDAMTTDRPYRQSLTADQATQEIVRGSASQFDPEVIKAFVALHKEGKI